MVKGSRLSAIAATLAVSACAGQGVPCFNSSSLVIGTQVLAMRSDPPEAFIDLEGDAQPDPVELSALVVYGQATLLGDYGRSPQLTQIHTVFLVCTFPAISEVNAPPGCPAGSAVIADLDKVPDMDTPLVYTPSLALLHAAVDQDPVHGLGGVQLLVEMDVGDGAAMLRATATLHFLLKDSPVSLNHGLVLTAMEASKGGAHLVVPFQDVIRTVVAQPMGLRPLIAPGQGGVDAVETYLAYNHNGVLTQYTEHVTYAFFDGSELFFGQLLNGQAVYSGAPGSEADELPAGSPDPPNGLVSFEAVYPRDQAGNFWVVARDDRGAVTWAHPAWSAEEIRPSCLLQPGQMLGATKCPKENLGCE